MSSRGLQLQQVSQPRLDAAKVGFVQLLFDTIPLHAYECCDRCAGDGTVRHKW